MRAETLSSNSSIQAGAAEATVARIGPNSVLQTHRALIEVLGPRRAAELHAAVGLPDPLPPGMIPERWFLSYVMELRRALPAERAEAVLRRSGRYTADYVRAHRIPRPFKWLLALLPERVAIPLLLFAFRQHAWTFAGGGAFTVQGEFPGTIVLERCPTCRIPTSHPHGGSYYEAAFEGLLALASPRARVREVACATQGAPHCHFQITLGTPR